MTCKEKVSSVSNETMQGWCGHIALWVNEALKEMGIRKKTKCQHQAPFLFESSIFSDKILGYCCMQSFTFYIFLG